MFRFAFRLIGLIALIVGSAAVLAAAPPGETTAPMANAGWEEMGVGSASGGGISNNKGWSIFPSVAISPNGAPVIAWADDSGGNSEIYVRRWDGSSWVDMGRSASGGGISNNPGISTNPSLVVDPGGAPIVAWSDNTIADDQVYARRWNGSDWVEMAFSGSGGGISMNGTSDSHTSLAIGLDGSLAVAWVSTSNEIYLRRWNGSAWVELGGSASGGGVSNTQGASRPSLAIGPDGLPVIAWGDYSSGGITEIYVRRWDGSAWVELGGSGSGGGISNNESWSSAPSLAIGPDGLPIVAWVDSDIVTGQILVRRWNGSAWVEMGNGSDLIGADWKPSLVISPDGVPIVAWSDADSIYVRRWIGTAWVELETSSALDADIGDSNSLSLAIGLNDVPVITWNSLEGVSEIFVRRFQPCYPLTQTRSLQGRIANVTPVASENVLFLPTILNVLRFFAGPLEFEPNNTLYEANGPLCSGRAYTGLPNDRYDVFSLEAVAGLVSIDLTNHVGSGVQLQLHHQAITPNPLAIDYTGADGYHIEVPNAPAGRYYVVISTQTPDPGATTRYQLTPTFNMSR